MGCGLASPPQPSPHLPSHAPYVYWAIVTLTTVGFGDIAPATPLGQTLAAAVMIMGYGIIAVPTGIVTAQLIHASRWGPTSRACANCGRQGHDSDATYCKGCGANLGAPPDSD